MTVGDEAHVGEIMRRWCSLAGLTQRQIDVVSAKAMGWKQREIASWLGVCQSDVSRILKRARQRLRAVVGSKIDEYNGSLPAM